jgi:hypothetical protein
VAQLIRLTSHERAAGQARGATRAMQSRESASLVTGKPSELLTAQRGGLGGALGKLVADAEQGS